MAIFLATFTPLAFDEPGRTAARRFGHPPYTDASCRRTPDFEAQLPSISAVCRGRNFAPRLHVGDIVVYLTRQGRYEELDWHWRLVAVLRVRTRFATHQEAAAWHRATGLDLPSDCIVDGNPPLPTVHTHQPGADLASWDARYAERVRAYGAFLVCDPLWMDLFEPRVVSRRLLTDVFGKVPTTRTPPAISEAEYQRLLNGAGAVADGSHVRRPEKSTTLGVRGSDHGGGPPSGPASAVGCGAPARRSRRGCV